MFLIPAFDLCDVRRLFKRYFGIRGDDSQIPVQFLADETGLTVRAIQRVAAIRYHIPGTFPETRFSIPLAALAQCCTSRRGQVEMSLGNPGNVTIEWRPAGVTRQAEAATIAEAPLEFPDSPPQLAIQPPGIP